MAWSTTPSVIVNRLNSVLSLPSYLTFLATPASHTSTLLRAAMAFALLSPHEQMRDPSGRMSKKKREE